jgi:hypothetical protein
LIFAELGHEGLEIYGASLRPVTRFDAPILRGLRGD